MIADDLNGHVGQHSWGFHPHHCMVMEHIIRKEWEYNLCAATDLAVTNTVFRKSNSVTYYSGKLRKQVTYNSRGSTTQVHYNLLEEQTWNSIRMLKSTKMKNASHNTNYLLLYSRFKFPQRSHIHFIAGKLKLCRLSQ